MIHNDTTRSAERRNTLSFSLCLFVCLSYFFEGQPRNKKAKKTAAKAYPEFLRLIHHS